MAGIPEQGDGDNIWAKEGASNKRLEKDA